MPTESTVARPVADQKKKMSKRNKNDTVNESYGGRYSQGKHFRSQPIATYFNC